MNKKSHSTKLSRIGGRTCRGRSFRRVFFFALLCSLGFGAVAQEFETGTLEAMMLDYDTALTVGCSYDLLPKLVLEDYHREPVNGQYTIWSDSYRHTCESDNAQAQHIFLSRLEKLNSPEIYRHRLSYEAEKIVFNFELITGIPNSRDGDFFGLCYVSHLTRTGWKRWFEKNKHRLRYCPQYRVLYVSIVPSTNL